MKKNSLAVTNIGSVSLLMTFIVLCLVTFATLSLSGAVGDYHFSQNLAGHTTEFYNASNEATKKLSQIDDMLSLAYQNPSTYYESAKELAAKQDWLACDFSSEEPTFTYQIDMNDTQALTVVLKLNSPGNMQDGFYRITTWKEGSTKTWNGSDSLNLIN